MIRAINFLTTSLVAVAGLAAVDGTASAQPYGYDYDGPPTVQVYSGDGWYPAQIVESRGAYYLVHYDNTGYESDEWVDASRVRGLGYLPIAAYEPAVRVYWGNSWYDGLVLGVSAGRYHVRYRGIDEWVYPSRLHMHARGHAWRGWGTVHRGGGYHYRVEHRNDYGRRNNNDWGNHRGGRHDNGNHGGRHDNGNHGGRNGGRHHGR